MSPRRPREPLDDPAATSDAPPPTNARVAAVLLEVADLLEVKGDSAFKVAAYRRAAESVARSGVEVAAAYRSGTPPPLPGVGSTISERIAELAARGRLAYHEDLRAEVPPTLLELLAVPGVGPRTAGEVWRWLGVATLDDLEAAARSGRLRTMRGLSARSEARILEGIGELRRRPPRRMLMGDAREVAADVVARLTALPDVVSAMVAGSVRRGCETAGDIDVVIESDRPEAALAAIDQDPAFEAADAGTRGGRDRASLRFAGGPSLDLMVAPVGSAGSALVHLTGSAEHNVGLRHRARRSGWSLSEHGLVPLADRSAAPLSFATEADLYAFLGLAHVPPELREGRGEIEAAERGELPRLVSLEDLRGDCHSHSHWSDGREPLEVMAESARQDGRAYQALTDHSQSLTIANGLSPARVEAQRRVIRELNDRFAREHAVGIVPPGADPGGFVLLHGTELEITPEGDLDYDDVLLASFDVVVASLHVGRRQPRKQLMARYERALRSPYVHIISHPSGRKIGQRTELDLDWDAFYRLAAETGTLLEINGSQARLDLDEHRIRAAADAGCRFTIDSDAHERREWRHLAFGTTMARRAWLTPDVVANTLPPPAFLALLAEKRRRV